MTAPRESLLTITNRLPVTVVQSPDGPQYRASVGGVATGLSSISDQYDSRWIGWPGDVNEADQPEVSEHLVRQLGCYPVFLPRSLTELYYEGYSNRTLWPILHSFTTFARYALNEWEAYVKANAMFCEATLKQADRNPMIWIHDLQLMLLPRMLREALPDARIGFFLHIPFPGFEIFRCLPQYREILNGLLGADLIGFHTYEYAQAFLGCVRRVFAIDPSMGQIHLNDRLVQVDVFPMGIDVEKYESARLDPSQRREILEIQGKLGEKRKIISISRLDYSKGLPETLQAFDHMLSKYSEWREKVELIFIVVPSREGVEQYAMLKKEIDELVGNINGRFGSLTWTPVNYSYRALTFSEIIALYSAADVALIAPLRDGMNLIAKEFLAVKKDQPGVLVLSEFAGSAKELLEALIVNPNSKEEVALALHMALSMPVEEQILRNATMRDRLRSNDISHWVSTFVESLRRSAAASRQLAVRVLDSNIRQTLLARFNSAGERLLVLDYDGTLIPFAAKPALAKPDPELLDLISRLAENRANRIVILSGRDRQSLSSYLNNVPVTLAAEHGAWVRWPGDSEWQSTVAEASDDWKEEIRAILARTTDRIPGSFVEEKDFSLVWHYRQADQSSAAIANAELLDTLVTFGSNLNVQILPAKKALEIRRQGISKGNFYRQHLAPLNAPFVLAAGDDWTDENLFAVLHGDVFSIRIGLAVSKARFNLKTIKDLRELLQELATSQETFAEGPQRPSLSTYFPVISYLLKEWRRIKSSTTSTLGPQKTE